MNSTAIRILGLDDISALSDGWIEHDESGRATGLVVDGDESLVRLGLPRRTLHDLEGAIAELSQDLALAGITAVTDATASNDQTSFDVFCKLSRADVLKQRWNMLEGAFPFLEDQNPGDRRFSGVKVVLSDVTGNFSPDANEMREILRRAQNCGLPVAVHVLDEAALAVALACLEDVTASVFHRLEHVPVCPPHFLERIRATNSIVVVQPAHIELLGDALLEEKGVPESWLYPIRSMLDSSIEVRSGSDSPAGDLDPLAGSRAAVQRRTASGLALSPHEALSPAAALQLHGGIPSTKRSYRRRRAEVVILDEDPRTSQGLSTCAVTSTIIGPWLFS